MPLFTNQATLTYTGGAATSNIVTGQLVEAINVTKTALDNTYRANDVVTYTISLTNTDAVPYTNLTVTDDLGGYAFDGRTVYPLTYVDGAIQYYENGVLQPTPTVTAGPPLTVTGITVPAGGNAQIIYSARVNEFAPLGAPGTINNTVSVAGAPLTEPVTAAEVVTPEAAPDLSINKAINPATVSPGDTVTYTFTILNNGSVPATAAENVVITDTFDPALTLTSVTYNGTPWTAPANYNYTQASGLFTSGTGQITVPAATYTQDPTTGATIVTPGTATLVVSGTV